MNSLLSINNSTNNAQLHPREFKKICLYSHSTENDALAYLRILGPAQKLGLQVIRGMENSKIYSERAAQADVVILQRDFPLHLADYEKILDVAHKAGKPVILDLDDMLLELPEEHPERKNHYYAKALLPILQAIIEVDLVTVSTSLLRDSLLPYNPNIVVLPNCFNDEIWSFKAPVAQVEPPDKVVIGYMGGNSHKPDLDMITSVLLQINHQYPDRLQFNFWGMRPPTELASVAQVNWYHPDTNQYPDFAAYFQTQKADIFLGPLVDNHFNACKSPIKFFEYSALGAPGIFSRLAPYSDVISHGQDGLLASSLEEWVDYLSELINNPERRSILAANAQITIKSKWLLSQNAWRWMDAYQKAALTLDAKGSANSPLLGLVKSFSHQIAEDQANSTHQISILTKRMRIISPMVAEIGFFIPLIKFKIYRRIQKDLNVIHASGLFDSTWYLANNPDVAEARVDPIHHYLLYGGFERRNPGPNFSSGWYLDSYEDVKVTGINPLVHFVKYGIAEGRMGHPDLGVQMMTAQMLAPGKTVSLRARLIPYGSQRERLLRAVKRIIRLPLGIFSGSKRAKLTYIIRQTPLFVRGKAILGIIKTKVAEHSAKVWFLKFLSSVAVIELPHSSEPLISIILLFHNRAEMSLQCLESLAASAGQIPFEVIIVDNASSDKTSILLERTYNAKIIRNVTNTGFGEGCNRAVDRAAGKYLLFLNNDTQLQPNALNIMLETIESDPKIGAVGGKLIFPNGRLQEAGSIIWQDGSCQGYGRGEDPSKPEFCYVKDVDYCSAALLLTPKELFESLGKFDPRYTPSYYEDVDYCMRLWNNGHRVVFQPFAIALHNEFGNSGKAGAIALQIKNREKFVEKWRDVLPSYIIPTVDNILPAREHKTQARRILFIDDRIPDYRIGSGYPRTYRLLLMLAELGYKLTFFPMVMPLSMPEIARELQMKGIEVISREVDLKLNFETFIKSRPNYYDIAFVSRPHNMEQSIKNLKKHAGQTAIVYDAEALFAMREVKYRELIGQHMTESEKEKLIHTEVALVKDAGAVVTVSEAEKELFVKHGATSVHVLSHIIIPTPTPAGFEERQGILFVGSILHKYSPNADAVYNFFTQILPLIRQEINCDFYIVGTNDVEAIWNMESEHVHVTGKVEDLTPYYNRCRLFVVPTRYSAGIPLKLLEAAAYGLPAVVTPLTANQLRWQANRDLLVGENPADFARKVIDLYSNQDLFYSLRQNALNRIRNEYSPEQFKKTLDNVISLAMDEKARFKIR